jgi:DUF1680 family protein
MASESLRKLHPLPLAQARWTSGLLAERFNVCRDSTIPALARIMEETERVRFVGNFEVAAGMIEGRHRGPKWNDGDFYKWLEAASAMLAFAAIHPPTAGQSESAAPGPAPIESHHLDDLIALIARTQASDGYIHTDVQIAQRNGQNTPRFGNPMDFEMYNMGHLISAACVHYHATGQRNLLDPARKAADFLAKEFAHPTPAQARHGICPSHLMALIDLYHTTQDPRYRDLAQILLEMRDLVTNGDDDNQDRIPFRQQTQAVGHAVRASYLYAGATDIYAESPASSASGPPTSPSPGGPYSPPRDTPLSPSPGTPGEGRGGGLLEALTAIWHDLTTRKLSITGGCGALFDGASPDGAEDQKTIARVHQSFGRDYQLPNSTAHNEMCAAIGNLLWNWRMLQVTSDPRYADVIEQTLYNSVLAGVSLEGTRFFYTNTLRQLDPMPVPLRWPRHRQPTLSCLCCPPNVARTIAQSPQYAYAVSERGLHVVLYGANQLQTTFTNQPLHLKQETDYPWDGHIRITFEHAPTDEFSIFLRIPAWARDATVTINGKMEPARDVNSTAVSPGTPSSPPPGAPSSPSPGTRGVGWGGGPAFRELRRAWKPGDIIDLNLPMPVRLIESNPLVEESRNHVAVMRGPIVYCLESVDLPKGVRLLDSHLPQDPALKPVRMPALANAIALEGKGIQIPSGNWGEELYRERAAQKRTEFHVLLVPYFTWDNRAEGEMSVWLPIAHG